MNMRAIIHARILLQPGSSPLRGCAMGKFEVLEDGAILFDESRIHSVCRTDLLPQGLRLDEEIDAKGRLVTPGFVDSHTHLVFAGCRRAEFEIRCQGGTYQEIAAAGGGIQNTAKAVQAENFDQLVSDARARIKWARSLGTTTIEIKSGYGLTPDAEAAMLRAAKAAADLEGMTVRRTFLGLHAIPTGRDKQEFIDEAIIVTLPRAVAQGVDYADAFIEEGYFTLDDARHFAAAAKTHGLKLRMHADQFGDHGAAALAAELGAVSADHLEYTGNAGINALAKSETSACLLPSSVYGLGLDHYPNARRLIEAGCIVTLATDFNPGSSPNLSIPFTMNLACLKMKMTPAEAWASCTINAAHSLGLGHQKGSIQPGHDADLILWEAEDYRDPIYWIGGPPRTVFSALQRSEG